MTFRYTNEYGIENLATFGSEYCKSFGEESTIKVVIHRGYCEELE